MSRLKGAGSPTAEAHRLVCGHAAPRPSPEEIRPLNSTAQSHPFAEVFAHLAFTARRHEATFQAARCLEGAFAAYPSATALLDALAPASPLSVPERQVAVEVLIRLHQTTGHPLWQALLLRAFEPLLLGLRAKDRGRKGDRNQRVLTAFLTAIAKLRVDGRPVFVAVGRAAARTLFQAVRVDSNRLEMVPYDDRARHSLSQATPDPFTACLANEVAAHVAARKGGDDIVRVLAGVETVAEQAARLAATASAGEREPVSPMCLYKRRELAIRDLRARLARDAAGDLA
jgi:hypothetical protein